MEHEPTPWRMCGEDRDGCVCGQIWCHDYPIAVVTRGTWGDKYPALRFVDQQGKECAGTSIGARAEAYIEMIEYGEVPPGLAMANARFIVQACNSHEELLEALSGLLEIENRFEGCEHADCVVCADTQARVDKARAALITAGG